MGNGMIATTFFQDIWNGLCSTLYAMFSILFRLMDWIQSVFRALVGLEPMKVNGTIINDGEQKMDVVFHLIQTDIVQDIFWSMVTFSLILMFIMTFIAIIRNSYQDKPKPIGTIIGDVFKGLVGMILIPVACFAGLMFGNVILQAVDAGTSFGSASTLSETLFMASAYDANIARDTDSSEGFWSGLTNREENYQNLIENTNFGEYLNKHGASNYNTTEKNEISVWEESDWEKIADHIDDAFTAGAIAYNANGEELDLYDPWRVNVCYNMGSFNFIIMLVGGCTMIGFLFKMCFGLITRMFKLVFDFVLIPVVLAMMPFDGGKATGTWKGDFVKNVTLSYGTIGAINLFYSILPIVNDLEFTWGHGGFFTAILKLVMVIIGLFSAEKLITTVTGWFGVGDLIGEGKSAYDTFKGGLDKVTKQTKNVTGKVTGLFAGGMAGAKQARNTGGNRFGGFLAGAYGGSGLKAKLDPLMPKGFGDAEKAGKEAYNASRKFGFSEDMKKKRTAEFTYQEEKNKIKKQIDDLDKRFPASARRADPNLQSLYETLYDQTVKGSSLYKNYDANGGTYLINGNKLTAQAIDSQKKTLEKQATTRQSANDVLEKYSNIYEDLEKASEKMRDVGAYIDRTGNLRAISGDITDAMREAYAEQKAAEAAKNDIGKTKRAKAKFVLGMLQSGLFDVDGKENVTGKNFVTTKVKLSDIEGLTDTELDAAFSHLNDETRINSAKNKAEKLAEELQEKSKSIDKQKEKQQKDMFDGTITLDQEQKEKMGKNPE